jgi:glycosyltransferase involved in cell wall biosynthesis
MKIAILSKADASGGGASRVAQELRELLEAGGHTAHHFVSLSSASQKPGTRHLYGHPLLGKAVRKANSLLTQAGFPELIPWELFFLHLNKIQTYDLLHFHDLSSAISPFTVRFLSRSVPTVWTFHDCSPFTGGCLYPMVCTNFTTRCGQCPQLGQWPINSKFDFTGLMQDIKRKTARENRFVPVTPSAWLAAVAAGSGMFAAPVQVIPNGVDTNVFQPVHRAAVKQTLGLPTSQPVVLITAAHIHEERKGVRFALKALQQIKHLEPCLLIVGHLDDESRAAFAEFQTHPTGYLQDDHLKSHYFAAADVHLFTSLADNMPLTVLETMATGTPTVGFATGGVPEMIDHCYSGYLAPPQDVAGLVRGLYQGLVDGQAPLWGQNARVTVEQRYSHQIFLKNHLALYEKVIHSRHQ